MTKRRVWMLKAVLCGVCALAAAASGCAGGQDTGQEGYGQSADDAYNAGKRLLQDGDKAGAAKAFKVSVDRNPRFVMANYDLALVLRDLGQDTEALAAIEQVTTMDSNLSGAHLLQAELNVALKRYEAALEAATKALALDETLTEAKLYKAMAFEALGRKEEALDAYEALLEEDPGNKEASLRLAAILLDNGDSATAIPRLVRLIEQRPDMFEAYIVLGRAYIARRAYERAVETLQKALTINSDDAEARRLLGSAYLLMGQDSMAVIELQKALELDPELAEAYVSMGEAELRLGFPQRALDMANKALTKDSKVISAYMLQAKVHQRREEYLKMEQSLRDALAINPRVEQAIVLLARQYLKGNNARPAQVIAMVEAAIAAGPVSSQVMVLAADAAQAAGDKAAAVKYLAAALKVSDEVMLKGRLVGLALSLPDNAGMEPATLVVLADEHYQGSHQNNVKALLLLAKAHVLAGDTERAVSILEAAAGRIDDPRIKDTLADIKK